MSFASTSMPYSAILITLLLLQLQPSHTLSSPRPVKAQMKISERIPNKNGQEGASSPSPSPSPSSSLSPSPCGADSTFSFSVPLVNPRPKPDNIFATFGELWNDPRPIGSVISGKDRSYVGQTSTSTSTSTSGEASASASPSSSIPYCIISDEFEIEKENYFQVLLYPRGRFVGSANDDSNITSGPAAAYLRYLPREYGDEIDIAWKLRLIGKDGEALPISTSGGLPMSKDTYSTAMTMCTENEAIESVGRATDWGSSTWFAQDVCNNLQSIRAEGEMTVFDVRKKENSVLTWPPLSKGAIGAVRRSSSDAAQSSVNKGEGGRNFRVGEVIVPTKVEDDSRLAQSLKESFIYPGIDYRIMTMADKDGNEIFSTKDLDGEERSQARLALRPCGWKLQQQVWKKNGMTNEWPVEVSAGKLSESSLTRFNPGSAIPRVTAAFNRDWLAYTAALLIALTPIPMTLLVRNAVSLYAIPSASMEPTFLRGDVLLVEKLPRAYDRSNRGDVILFRPPNALRDIVTSNGSQLSSTSLFVKRIVGLPGDQNIKLISENDVTINGQPALGPDRNLCADEPLRLIDRILEKGKGTDIKELGADETYVLGDCKAVSIDSRVFGTLPKENIVGKPIGRIWPLNRFKISGSF